MPLRLRDYIGSETRDFAVKATRANPPKMSLALVLFGLVWLAFTSIFVVAFLGPLFVGNEVEFTANGVPTVAGPDNLGPIIAPAMIIGFFVLVGFAMLGFGLKMLLKKGGWYAGTPTRFIIYQGGSTRSIDWEQFSGDIEMSGDDEKGSITLQLRSGRMVSQKSGGDRYVPNTIYMSGIHDVTDVEAICRKRIKENDPTPTTY